jgi:hypothetical protein
MCHFQHFSAYTDKDYQNSVEQRYCRHKIAQEKPTDGHRTNLHANNDGKIAVEIQTAKEPG